MKINTNGKSTTEFKLLKAAGVFGMLYIVFLIIAENVFGWKIPDSADTIMALIFGGNATYAGSRGFFKGMLARAMGEASSTDDSK